MIKFKSKTWTLRLNFLKLNPFKFNTSLTFLRLPFRPGNRNKSTSNQAKSTQLIKDQKTTRKPAKRFTKNLRPCCLT